MKAPFLVFVLVTVFITKHQFVQVRVRADLERLIDVLFEVTASRRAGLSFQRAQLETCFLT